MEVKIDIRPRSKNVLLVAVRGKIGSETVEVFKQQLEKIILGGNSRLILDLKDVTYLNSIGLGVLASMLRLVRKENGDIKLFELPPGVKELFNITRLSLIFEVYDSEEDALKAF